MTKKEILQFLIETMDIFLKELDILRHTYFEEVVYNRQKNIKEVS